MLKQRIITALLLLPIALGGFFLLEGLQFALFIGAVITLGAWEWARLAGLDGQLQRCLFAVLVALLCAGLLLTPWLAWPLLGLAVVWWLVATLLVLSYPQSSHLWASRPVRLLIGLVVLLPAWQGLVILKQLPQGNGLILAVMVLVWAADIGAYFSGRAFGRRKLAPQVSPGKSWEGVFGGMLLCLLLTIALGYYQQWPFGQLSGALLGTVVLVLVSVVGDLNESMFKRQAGVKDSSNLLPGHGGILDRIDSLTAAIPLFAVLLWLAGWGVR